MEKCMYCNKEFKLGHHCEEKKKYIENIFLYTIGKDKFIDMYIHQMLSPQDIVNMYKQYNLKLFHIYKYLKIFNVPMRNASESINNPKCKKKKEDSNLKNGGAKHNFCKNHTSRIKWQKRLLDDEGIANVFQREAVKEKSKKTLLKNWGVEIPHHSEIIKQKGTNTCMKKYNTSHHMKNEDFKKNFIESMCTKHNILSMNELFNNHTWGNIYTKPHKIVAQLLIDNKISIRLEYILKVCGEIPNRYFYKYDILINDFKLIEVNGDFWHANPKFYKDTDIIGKHKWGYSRANQIWERDRQKIDFAIKKGYKIMIVWEDAIYNNWENLKKEILEYARN